MEALHPHIEQPGQWEEDIFETIVRILKHTGRPAQKRGLLPTDLRGEQADRRVYGRNITLSQGAVPRFAVENIQLEHTPTRIIDGELVNEAVKISITTQRQRNLSTVLIIERQSADAFEVSVEREPSVHGEDLVQSLSEETLLRIFKDLRGNGREALLMRTDLEGEAARLCDAIGPVDLQPEERESIAKILEALSEEELQYRMRLHAEQAKQYLTSEGRIKYKAIPPSKISALEAVGRVRELIEQDPEPLLPTEPLSEDASEMQVIAAMREFYDRFGNFSVHFSSKGSLQRTIYRSQPHARRFQALFPELDQVLVDANKRMLKARNKLFAENPTLDMCDWQVTYLSSLQTAYALMSQLVDSQDDGGDGIIGESPNRQFLLTT